MPVSPGASGMQPRDPCRPWRGTLASGPKPRGGLVALQSLESNPQLSFATRMEDWTCLGQHKRQPEFPVVTRESRRNSRKTTWLPRHRKMKPFPLLTEVEELGVSGISGVEWDAVELPSQFMENFCWEWDVLQGMTRHAETGAKLPRDLYDKMIAAKNFQSGLQMLRQIEFSLFDLRLHSDYDASGKQTVQQMLDEVRREVAVLIPPAF